MADLSDLNYNANDHDPMGTFTVVPAGDYLALIKNSEKKPTKAGTGKLIALEFQILEGEHKGAVVFSRLNLWNPNPKAVSFAKRELGDICRAVGVLQPRSTEELHNKPLVITVEVEERSDKPGSYSNNIKGYKPVSGGAVGVAEGRPAPAEDAPWRKGTNNGQATNGQDQIPF